jgi:hypothetical protein
MRSENAAVGLRVIESDVRPGPAPIIYATGSQCSRISRSSQNPAEAGYWGLNASKSGFGEFLRAAEAKEIPEDSLLLVENLDPVSRETLRKALELFLRVLGTGIGIVTRTVEQTNLGAAVRFTASRFSNSRTRTEVRRCR